MEFQMSSENKEDNPHINPLHEKVFRPWGSYESLAQDDGFQVKRITVKPGARLSLQKHKFREEFWVVAKGTARITVDDSVEDYAPANSIHIPLGAVHRMENVGEGDLEIIGIGSGKSRCTIISTLIVKP